ncbi:hypothetical protein C0993_002113, partial [Termitomyces sp. T159_Od127]
PSSSPHLESLNSSTQLTSPESNDQQVRSPHLVEQGNLEGSIQSARVEEDESHPSFMRSQEQRQETFLQGESERDRQFHASEAGRDTGEFRRSTIFDEEMNQWSKKSQTEQIRGREEERFRREIRRSIAFRNAESFRWTALKLSVSYSMDQMYGEEDLEDIHFRHEETLLALYERQAIQLDQRTEDQIVWFKFMRDRNTPFDWLAEEDEVLERGRGTRRSRGSSTCVVCRRSMGLYGLGQRNCIVGGYGSGFGD